MVPEESENTVTMEKKHIEEDRSKHTIVVVCGCGYSVTYTTYGHMENYQNCVGSCPKCGSKTMSIKCSKKIEELAA